MQPRFHEKCVICRLQRNEMTTAPRLELSRLQLPDRRTCANLCEHRDLFTNAVEGGLGHSARNTGRVFLFVIPGKAAGRDPESTPLPLDSSFRWNDGLRRVSGTAKFPRQNPPRNCCARSLGRASFFSGKKLTII